MMRLLKLTIVIALALGCCLAECTRHAANVQAAPTGMILTWINNAPIGGTVERFL